MGTSVHHDFTTHDTHVYPVQLYARLRSFVAESDGSWLKKMMSMRTCDDSMAAVSTGVGTRKFRREMEYRLMSTFLW